MQRPEHTILSTRPLPDAFVRQWAEQGFRFECHSFIETEPVRGPEFSLALQALAEAPRTVVFTSMNAVDAVAAQLDQTPAWEAYSIGQSTAQHIEEKLRIPIKGTAPDAAQLAQVILDAGETNLLFFCGNLRRDTLPLVLKAHKVRVEELIVYRTRLTPKRLEKSYDGALFYSPSAVESYFSANTPAPGTVLFAIGATTAAAVRDASANPLVVADAPGKEALALRAIEYLRTLSR